MAEDSDLVATEAGDPAPTEAEVEIAPTKEPRVRVPHRIPGRFLRSLAAAAFFGIGQHAAQTEESREAKRKLAMFDNWPAKLQRAFMQVHKFGVGDPPAERDMTPQEEVRFQRAAVKRTRRRIRNLTGVSVTEQRRADAHGITSDLLLAMVRGDGAAIVEVKRLVSIADAQAA